jgi:hypothetical protein
MEVKAMRTVGKFLLFALAAALAVPVTIGVFHSAWKPGSTAVVPVGAWSKVAPHLDRLDQASAEIGDKHLQRIRAFFNEKKRGATAFSEWALGWTAKYYLVKGSIQGDNGAGLRQWLQDKFAEHVFRGEDLQAMLASAIEGYLTDIQGLENDAFVQIRADIAQDELFKATMPELQSDQAFRDEYQRLAVELLPKLTEDLKVGVAGQIAAFIGSEIVAQPLSRGLLARVGLSSGGFWSAVGRSGVTIAVGVVAWVAIESVIDWLLNLFGYGPVAELATKVESSLDRMASQLIDGDAAAAAEYERQRQMERDDPTPDGQQQFRQEAERIEQSGALGLRGEFQKLQELQSKIRRAALLKLVTAQGGQ